MKYIDDSTLEAIAELICGLDWSGPESPGWYRTTGEINRFFERAGVVARGQSGTRKWFVLESLQQMNGADGLEKVLLRLASPKEYPGNGRVRSHVEDSLNNVLWVEGLEVSLVNIDPVLRERDVSAEPVPRESPVQVASPTSTQCQQGQPRSPRDTRVFIGHGRSHVWRELKDFLEDDLGLLVDEFSRVPTAGVSVTSRLSTMLSSAAIAFLVMTGEDEQPDGALRARENVVHEAGLFQGRLGFERAIVLLEDGCEKFSNNAGLVHINFPKDNIRASFQDIRDVLEREGVLQTRSTP